MMTDETISRRKADHLAITARTASKWPPPRAGARSRSSTTLPEIDRAAIDLGVTFLGRPFRSPIAIAG